MWQWLPVCVSDSNWRLVNTSSCSHPFPSLQTQTPKASRGPSQKHSFLPFVSLLRGEAAKRRAARTFLGGATVIVEFYFEPRSEAGLSVFVSDKLHSVKQILISYLALDFLAYHKNILQNTVAVVNCSVPPPVLPFGFAACSCSHGARRLFQRRTLPSHGYTMLLISLIYVELHVM